MPLLQPTIEYAAFFGDDFERKEAQLFLHPNDTWPLLNEVHDLDNAYRGLCMLRNKQADSLALNNLSVEQYAQRQAILDIARKVIAGERNRLLEVFISLAKGDPVGFKQGK